LLYEQYRMYQLILLGQAVHNAARLYLHICISLVTKKLYSIQNRFWHKNVKKGSLYYISTV